MEDFKKICSLLLMFAFAIGTIGGIGYCCYIHEYVVAVCVGLLGAMATPTIIHLHKYMMK